MIVTKQLRLDSSGANDTNQHPSSIFEANSTTQGVLFPRMTNAQMLAIPSPATGLIVYQTDGIAGLYQYSGAAWVGFSSNDYVVENWNTDANYTVVNTNAKVLIINQTGTLSTTRAVSLSSMTTVGATVVVKCGASVTSAINVRIDPPVSINGVGNSVFLELAYSDQTLYSSSPGVYTTTKPVFSETTTTLTTTKLLRGAYLGTGAFSGRNPTLPTDGDFVFAKPSNVQGLSQGIIFNGSGGASNLFIPSIETTNGWSWFVPGGSSTNYMNFFDGNPIRNGNSPTLNEQFNYGLYTFECFTDTNSSYCSGYFRVALNGTPSNLVFTKAPSNTGQLNVAIVSVTGQDQIQITSTGYVVTKVTNLSTLDTPDEFPTMFESYSSNGQTKHWTGTGGFGVGHSSQNAKAILQADSTDKGFLPPRMTLAQRSAITSVPIGLIVYQTDGTEGLYVYRNSGWTLLASAANNIRQVDVQLFNYALQQDVSYADAGTITTFINLNNQLSSATYQKFTYSAGVWSGGSVTNITFTAGVSTVSIAMAQYDFIRVVGVLAGANTQATLSIKTTIS